MELREGFFLETMHKIYMFWLVKEEDRKKNPRAEIKQLKSLSIFHEKKTSLFTLSEQINLYQRMRLHNKVVTSLTCDTKSY